MSPLSDAEIGSRLAALHLWTLRGNEIERIFACKNFDGSMAFVNAVADLANRADHHPDISISWGTVTLTLSSHDAGGLTDRDFDLAARIDELAREST